MQGGIQLQGFVWDEKSDTIGLKGDIPKPVQCSLESYQIINNYQLILSSLWFVQAEN